ncbi:hypothetical protein [Oceanobacter mangrovi]|uniref:hypothetical protein n=1 Tax=Oceanobacter mangrovi TaxID=2862510 RepID=UPI001C8EE96D|nr:hypothetical protein [Oceanobacter mangrovi]
MDTFFDPQLAWTAYVVAALIGSLCWRAMFFFLRKASLLRDLLVVLGPVLLLTPAPLTVGSSDYAPAFMVVAFAALNGEPENLANTVQWWLAGLLVGVLYALVRMIVRMQANKPAEPEDVDYAPK